jgi:ERCC4-type nuclease|uniref:ERCC4 domain-containing protein EP364R n=1 Tax=Siphoviridae sp. cteLh2 TaxID=2825590 RepID=A0A8S5U5N0_9CAUD|nr:ERCC4 domain-containing protein [uncultured Lachnoclostridium sp.]DAF89756.1 MAG TPA: ERCC4 domain protein [Siphoviridae sp. cteLh2]
MNKKNIDKLMHNNFYIIVDTREKKNKHIIDAFELYGIKYIKQKCEYGDYCAMLTKDEELGINEDIILKVSVERKASLDEIGANLTRGKERFAKEMIRCTEDYGSMIIMIEGNTYSDIINENYRIKLTSKQFLGLLHGLYGDYKIPFIFISQKDAPLFIYDTLKYFTRGYLKNI